MRVATITKSYPTEARPQEGVFIRSRMAAVPREVEVEVLHAVSFRTVRPEDEPGGSPPVRRVRYLYLPGVLKGLDHRFLARSLRPALTERHRVRGFDLLDAHFGYPEGAAAVRLGRELGLPVVVTLRGTEKVFQGKGARGRAMGSGLREADRVIAVSSPLADLAREEGVDPSRIHVIGNGVDTERFTPGNRAEARARLGLPTGVPVLVSVGALIERKGHHRMISMLKDLDVEHPESILLIVGDGPMEGELRRLARREGVENRVLFAGLVDRDRLPDHFRAADVLTLATRWEGWANVWLEALACGTPVVTTDVGAARDAIPEGAGKVVPFGDWPAFCSALSGVLREPPAPEGLRAVAEARTWQRVGEEVAGVFSDLIEGQVSEGAKP